MQNFKCGKALEIIRFQYFVIIQVDRWPTNPHQCFLLLEFCNYKASYIVKKLSQWCPKTVSMKTLDTVQWTWNHLFLDKFVPVFVRERPGADDEFIPVPVDVIISWLLSDPHAIELQAAAHFFLTLEHNQRHLQAETWTWSSHGYSCIYNDT